MIFVIIAFTAFVAAVTLGPDSKPDNTRKDPTFREQR